LNASIITDTELKIASPYMLRPLSPETILLPVGSSRQGVNIRRGKAASRLRLEHGQSYPRLESSYISFAKWLKVMYIRRHNLPCSSCILRPNPLSHTLTVLRNPIRD
jgi:hypothetical protein